MAVSGAVATLRVSAVPFHIGIEFLIFAEAMLMRMRLRRRSLVVRQNLVCNTSVHPHLRKFLCQLLPCILIHVSRRSIGFHLRILWLLLFVVITFMFSLNVKIFIYIQFLTCLTKSELTRCLSFSRSSSEADVLMTLALMAAENLAWDTTPRSGFFHPRSVSMTQ